MPTRTASNFVAIPRAVHAGVNAISITVGGNLGYTLSASKTAILLARLPSGARINSITEFHTSGAATAPTEFGWVREGQSGTRSISISAFATSQTLGVVHVLEGGIDFTWTPNTSVRSLDLVAVPGLTAGSDTKSYKLQVTVMYTMDGIFD